MSISTSLEVLTGVLATSSDTGRTVDTLQSKGCWTEAVVEGEGIGISITTVGEVLVTGAGVPVGFPEGAGITVEFSEGTGVTVGFSEGTDVVGFNDGAGCD